METQSNIVYYQDGDFTLRLVPTDQTLLMHCDVSVWNTKTLRNMYRVFASLLSEAKETPYVQLMTISPNPKFAKLFGGDTEQSFTQNGIEYEVIVWDLK